MRLPLAARQAMTAAIVAALVGGLVLVAVLAVRLQDYQASVASATELATGEVVDTDIGDDADIRVAWVDARGVTHRTRLGVYESYDEGDRFDIRYDPADPSTAFPADPEETSAEDDLVVPMLLTGVLFVGVLLAWGLRWWWWRRTARRPGEHVGVTVMGDSWLRIGTDRYQRVMWDPRIDDLGEVTVHGSRRVVVALADGTALVPCGRLRRKAPDDLEPGYPLGGGLAEVLILPAGVDVPVQQRWRRATGFGLLGSVLGAVLSFVFGTSALVTFGCMAATAGLLVSIWAAQGGAP